jgi:hypothetical protein
MRCMTSTKLKCTEAPSSWAINANSLCQKKRRFKVLPDRMIKKFQKAAKRAGDGSRTTNTLVLSIFRRALLGHWILRSPGTRYVRGRRPPAPRFHPGPRTPAAFALRVTQGLSASRNTLKATPRRARMSISQRSAPLVTVVNRIATSAEHARELRSRPDCDVPRSDRFTSIRDIDRLRRSSALVDSTRLPEDRLRP